MDSDVDTDLELQNVDLPRRSLYWTPPANSNLRPPPVSSAASTASSVPESRASPEPAQRPNTPGLFSEQDVRRRLNKPCFRCHINRRDCDGNTPCLQCTLRSTICEYQAPEEMKNPVPCVPCQRAGQECRGGIPCTGCEERGARQNCMPPEPAKAAETVPNPVHEPAARPREARAQRLLGLRMASRIVPMHVGDLDRPHRPNNGWRTGDMEVASPAPMMDSSLLPMLAQPPLTHFIDAQAIPFPSQILSHQHGNHAVITPPATPAPSPASSPASTPRFTPGSTPPTTPVSLSSPGAMSQHLAEAGQQLPRPPEESSVLSDRCSFSPRAVPGDMNRHLTLR